MEGRTPGFVITARLESATRYFDRPGLALRVSGKIQALHLAFTDIVGCRGATERNSPSIESAVESSIDERPFIYWRTELSQ
jgi:uncharacterized NAD(P)/FAD-binding protein YdhS